MYIAHAVHLHEWQRARDQSNPAQTKSDPSAHYIAHRSSLQRLACRVRVGRIDRLLAQVALVALVRRKHVGALTQMGDDGAHGVTRARAKGVGGRRVTVIGAVGGCGLGFGSSLCLRLGWTLDLISRGRINTLLGRNDARIRLTLVSRIHGRLKQVRAARA